MLPVQIEKLRGRISHQASRPPNKPDYDAERTVVDRTSVASMLASKNVRPAVRSQEAGLPWIRLLAGELYCRLKEAQTISEGIWPRTISLKYRLEEFTWWSFGT